MVDSVMHLDIWFYYPENTRYAYTSDGLTGGYIINHMIVPISVLNFGSTGINKLPGTGFALAEACGLFYNYTSYNEIKGNDFYDELYIFLVIKKTIRF
ncbi:hypothetical protein ACNR90_000040, partial [Candidozyma auris]